MGLEVYQQCVLIVFLGIRGVKLGEIMKCGIGEAVNNENAKVECFHVKDYKEETHLAGNCKLVECDPNKRVMWKMLDDKLGKIEVHLHGLSHGCDFDYYDIYLEVYDAAEPVNEPHRCLAGSWLWKTHSRRTLTNLKCSGCSRDPTNCIQVHTLIFTYVYPGLFRIKITPRLNNGSTRQSQVSHYFHMDGARSRYAKKRLVDVNFSIILQYRDSTRQLDVGIPLGMDVPPAVVGFEVKYSPQYTDLYAVTRYGSKEEKEVACRSGENLTKPECYATDKLIHCTFYNMPQGSYKIVVEFIDDRCRMDTVWTETGDDYDVCRWDIKKDYSALPGPKEPLVKSSHSVIMYSAISLSILLFVLVVAFMLRKRCRYPGQRLFDQSDPGNPGTAVYSANDSPASNRFNFGQLLTLSERPRAEVLVLYARETPAFMELVTRLKSVLDKICKCKVYDCFDMEFWNEISKDPEGWIRTLIVERQAKVVIVASRLAAIRQRSLMCDEPDAAQKYPHPFNHLFLYALKVLRDGMDTESYKNHFVVTFDGLTEAEPLIEYFNPYTRFVLPKHLNRLFDHLHDSGGPVHFETSRRLEERFEVRQLRLQIEHLINMKLLAKSDVRTEELYDWKAYLLENFCELTVRKVLMFSEKRVLDLTAKERELFCRYLLHPRVDFYGCMIARETAKSVDQAQLQHLLKCGMTTEQQMHIADVPVIVPEGAIC